MFATIFQLFSDINQHYLIKKIFAHNLLDFKTLHSCFTPKIFIHHPLTASFTIFDSQKSHESKINLFAVFRIAHFAHMNHEKKYSQSTRDSFAYFCNYFFEYVDMKKMNENWIKRTTSRGFS